MFLVVLEDDSVIKLLPFGIKHESNTKCVLGNGVVIPPKAILRDFNNLSNNGIDFERKLFVSER